MAEQKPVWGKIEQRLAVEPIRVGGRTIQPVAQASGWQWSGGGSKTDFTGALVRIRPLEIVVQEASAVRIVPVDNSAHKTWRVMLPPALMVSLGCLLVMRLAQWFTRHR